MTLLEVVAAALLLLGSFLVIQALIAADRWEREETDAPSRVRQRPPSYRRAA